MENEADGKIVEVLNKEKYMRALESQKGFLSQELRELLEILNDDYVQITRMVKDQEEHLSVKEVAQLFGVTEAAVYKWIEKEKIEYIQPVVPGGKGYLIPKKQFENRLLDRQKVREAHKKYILKEATEIDLEDRTDLFRS